MPRMVMGEAAVSDGCATSDTPAARLRTTASETSSSGPITVEELTSMSGSSVPRAPRSICAVEAGTASEVTISWGPASLPLDGAAASA